MGRFFRDLPPRSHGAVITPSGPTRFRTLARYLRTGLALDWYCVWVSRPGGLAATRRRMRAHGIDPRDHPGTLSLRDGSRFVSDRREIDWDRWNEGVESVFREARRLGKAGVWWSGELPSYLLETRRPAAWYQLEMTLHDLSPECTVLCLYDRGTLLAGRSRPYRSGASPLPARPRRVAELHSYTVLAESEETNFLLEPEAAPVIAPVAEGFAKAQATARIG